MDIMKLEKAVLYVSDVASLMGCSCFRVYSDIHSGKLKALKLKRSLIIFPEDFQNYVKSLGKKDK